MARKGFVRVGGFPWRHTPLWSSGALLQWDRSGATGRQNLGVAVRPRPFIDYPCSHATIINHIGLPSSKFSLLAKARRPRRSLISEFITLSIPDYHYLAPVLLTWWVYPAGNLGVKDDGRRKIGVANST
jgi:hypothetical protein